jgi:esterase
MQLHFRKFGSGCPLIILHGLYGSGDNWYTIGRKLSQYFTVYLVDLRNHGSSPHNPTFNYRVMTHDIEDFFQEENIEKACIMGHSMGGKVAMGFALLHPEKVKKLVILDIALRSYINTPQTLVHMQIVESLNNLDIFNATSRSEVDAQLAQQITQPAIRQFLLKNLKREENGRFYWGLNLIALMDNMQELLREVETDNLQFIGPVLVVSGKNSGYINDSDRLAFTKAFPDLHFEELDSGHWIHAEQPEQLMQLLLSFLPDN